MHFWIPGVTKHEKHVSKKKSLECPRAKNKFLFLFLDNATLGDILEEYTNVLGHNDRAHPDPKVCLTHLEVNLTVTETP